MRTLFGGFENIRENQNFEGYSNDKPIGVDRYNHDKEDLICQRCCLVMKLLFFLHFEKLKLLCRML